MLHIFYHFIHNAKMDVTSSIRRSFQRFLITTALVTFSLQDQTGNFNATCTGTSCSLNLNISVPNLNISVVQNELASIRTLSTELNTAVTASENVLANDKQLAPIDLTIIGYEISNLMQHIYMVNRDYAATVSKVYQAQDDLSKLSTIANCFKKKQDQCSTQTTSSTSSAVSLGFSTMLDYY